MQEGGKFTFLNFTGEVAKYSKYFQQKGVICTFIWFLVFNIKEVLDKVFHTR